jgi:hypothetical protein
MRCGTGLRRAMSSGGAALVGFISAHAVSRSGSRDGMAGLPVLTRTPVLIAQAHLALQHRAYELGDGSILLGRLPAGPKGGLIG